MGSVANRRLAVVGVTRLDFVANTLEVRDLSRRRANAVLILFSKSPLYTVEIPLWLKGSNKPWRQTLRRESIDDKGRCEEGSKKVNGGCSGRQDSLHVMVIFCVISVRSRDPREDEIKGVREKWIVTRDVGDNLFVAIRGLRELLVREIE